MEQDLLGLNYHTIYSTTGTVNRDCTSDCCFCYVTKYHPEFEMDNTYEIVILSDETGMEEYGYNNMCMLTENEIRYYINMLSKYVPFEWDLTHVYSNGQRYVSEEEMENNEDLRRRYILKAYKLHLHINGTYMQHKFVLISLRGLYEFPFNMALMDVFTLRTEEKYKKYTTTNLYIMISYIFGYFDSYFDAIDDQSLVSFCHDYPIFKTRDEVIKQLEDIQKSANDIDDCRIHNVWDYTSDKPESADHHEFNTKFQNYLESVNVGSYDYWADPDTFENRKGFYDEAINTFCKSSLYK